jgi:putative DNA primase/helicase
MSADGGRNDVSATAEAEEFLQELLADGPVPSKQVKADSKEAVIAWRTIERAKSRLGIVANKTGMDGGWMWSLPRRPQNFPEDRHQKEWRSSTVDGGLRDDDAPEPGSFEPEDDLDIPDFLRRGAA